MPRVAASRSAPSRPARRPRRATPRAPGPPLAGALLRTCWQQVRAELQRALKAAGFDDLQDAHLTVFQYPGPEGLRPSELAKQVRMSRQATNYLIAQLEDRGYLERRAPSEAERRRVHVTPRGRQLIAAMRTTVQRVEGEWASVVGRARFEAFMDVLRALASRP